MLPLAGAAFGLALLLVVSAYAVAQIDAVDGRRALLVGVALLAVGGALAVAVPAGPSAPAADGGAEATTNASERPTPAVEQRAAEPLTAAASTNATATTATVVGVASGDRLTYRTASGARRTVRLAGVDAPGVDGAAPERFDGVVTGSRGRTCLADHGRQALVSLRAGLVGESVAVAAVERTRGSDTAVLRADGRSINRRVVERGYARATDGRYADAERAARSATRGVWSCGVVTNDRPLRASNATGVRIAAVRPNPPGDDASLTEEYVVIENAGRTTVDLSDWHLTDEDGHRYFFFDGRELRPGERVVLHVGAGRNREGHLYWGATTPVLDDDNETLRLVDGDTDRVVRFSY